ncbi:hypothetical protein CMUST_11240 [Corynebacterium mustelae]|uniref:SPOR domain-containing protein n=1 Tax=Corynebacterium mustelae TaxID=571915 RepID=A0A0G3H3Z5_9CORY|nr:hypothetical protein [Corynebacterium mustelae]AKK06563.1 hypothetical protein CMUST_11240 [Corynebacterium mustelae]
MQNEDLKWFYNQETGQVEQGKVSSFESRMGPYDTREEAEHAIEIAAERTRAADAYDEKYNDED